MKQPAPVTHELIIESKTHGRFVVLYDAEDEDKVAAHKWYISKERCDFYVTSKILHPDGGWYTFPNGYRRRRQANLRLHRLIMGTPKGMQTDHINGKPLDNRKSNLRICTNAENGRNRGSMRNNTSGFKGVRYMKKRKDMINERSKPWQPQIRNNSHYIYLGYFATAEEAAEVYDRKACELWNIVSPERMLNFPERYKEYMSELANFNLKQP